MRARFFAADPVSPIARGTTGSPPRHPNARATKKNNFPPPRRPEQITLATGRWRNNFSTWTTPLFRARFPTPKNITINALIPLFTNMLTVLRSP